MYRFRRVLCTVVILLWPVAVRAATMSFLPAEPTAAIPRRSLPKDLGNWSSKMPSRTRRCG